MKIAFVTYATAHQRKGGLQTQMLQSKIALEERGVTVQYFSDIHHTLCDFDCLHIFGVSHANYLWIEEATRQNIPVVVSPIVQPNYNHLEVLRFKLLEYLALVLTSPIRGSHMYSTTKQIKQSLTKTGAIVAQSLKEKDMLSKLFGAELNTNIHIVSNGLETSYFNADLVQQTSTDPYVFLPGSISHYKNQKMVVEFLKGSSVKVILAGEILDQKYFDEIIKIGGNSVHYAGTLEPGSIDLKQYYANAIATVLYSQGETFGLVAIESLSQGTPVIMTDKNGLDLAQSSKYIQPIKTGNQKVLLDAINSVQAMQLTKEDKDAMLNEAKIFSWGSVAKNLKVIYEKLLH